MFLSTRPAPLRGAFRPIVTSVGAGCDGRFGALRRSAPSGWQKRVVLIARCRDQVCRIGDVGLRARHAGIRQATVAKKPGRRGEHAISRKPLRRECRHVRRTCDDLRACFFPFARKAAGAFRHPVLPAPSFQEGLAIQQKPGRVRAARSRSAAFSCLTFSRRTAGANHLGSAPRLDCAMPVRPPTLHRSCACR
jgi:hypothetical protein